MKVVVTGGCGYVGSVLVPVLLEAGHRVTVFDNLRKSGQALLSYFGNPALEFVRGDVRDENAVRKVVADADAVAHLAALVGFPLCLSDPWATRSTNVDGALTVRNALGRQQLLLFASSLSNYGTMPGEVCTEETLPKPITLYGITKMEAETRLLERENTIVFRPATAFGLSPQMRLDLLFNSFVQAALREKKLVVYEADYFRAFIHVHDFARAFLFALDHSEKMTNEIYNLGDETLNLTKGDLAQRISKRVGCRVELSSDGTDPDLRNYRVSFSKLKALGFCTKRSIDDGIEELVRAMPALASPPPFSNAPA
jgi:nucleoside-diphosphate-sugar epimerase